MEREYFLRLKFSNLKNEMMKKWFAFLTTEPIMLRDPKYQRNQWMQPMRPRIPVGQGDP